MADLGKVVVTDGGTYSASVTYEKLTFVHYNGDAYLTLKTVKGVTPTDDGTNYRLFCKSAVTATTSKAGIVMPDGSTISILNGKISAKKATQSAVGVVKGSDDINVDSNGAITVNTEFTQATALANLIAGEAIKVVLGKVSKAIATTMNLDQNALLKNMVSGIDANDGNKIPSSAFVHTLYERLGMGTDLSAGDAKNVTQAVNSLYSNLNNMWSLSGNQTLIPNNSDMHTYLTPGNYYCASNTNAETLKNSPLKFAFTMKVYLSVGIGSQYLIQEYTKYDASERILVYYDGNRNIWTSYHVQLEKRV